MLPRKQQMTVVLKLGTLVAMDTDEFPEKAPDNLGDLRHGVDWLIKLVFKLWWWKQQKQRQTEWREKPAAVAK